MSKVIKAKQVREEKKLRKIFEENQQKSEDQDNSAQPDTNQDSQKIEQLKVQAENEAAQLLEQAKKEAEQIMAQSEEEVQKMMEEGYQEGYNQGLEEGQKAGTEQVLSNTEQQIKNLQSEVERAQMKIDDKIEGLSQHVIQLASRVAGKIIKREVELDSTIIIDQVEGIITSLGRIESLTIRVNPSQLDILKEKKDDFLQLAQGINDIELVIDHSLKPGGCIVETNSGGADASVETQLETITNLLLEGNRDKDA